MNRKDGKITKKEREKRIAKLNTTLDAVIEAEIKSCSAEVDKSLAAIKADPLHGIEWSTESLVKNQRRGNEVRILQLMIKKLKEEKGAEWAREVYLQLSKNIDRMKAELISGEQYHRSTSQMANLCYLWERDMKSNLVAARVGKGFFIQVLELLDELTDLLYD